MASPPPPAAGFDLANFTSVDLNVTLYATIESFFTRLGQKEFIESDVLTNSMQTLGYPVRCLISCCSLHRQATIVS